MSHSETRLAVICAIILGGPAALLGMHLGGIGFVIVFGAAGVWVGAMCSAMLSAGGDGILAVIGIAIVAVIGIAILIGH